MIAVDDGSVRTPITAFDLEKSGVPGAIIHLRRNVGHQRAIAIGLNYVAENRPQHTCIVMDSDGAVSAVSAYG